MLLTRLYEANEFTATDDVNTSFYFRILLHTRWNINFGKVGKKVLLKDGYVVYDSLA